MRSVPDTLTFFSSNRNCSSKNAKNEDYSVVCILGDGGLSGGMAYEALNNIKELKGNFICILNDNNMSISPLAKAWPITSRQCEQQKYTMIQRKSFNE